MSYAYFFVTKLPHIMSYLLIAFLLASLLGLLISKSTGRFLNDVLNKKYPAVIYREEINKRSLRKARRKVIFSFQTISTIVATTALSVCIHSIIMSGIRYI